MDNGGDCGKNGEDGGTEKIKKSLKSKGACFASCFRSNLAIVLTFAGVFLGFALGVALRHWRQFSSFEIMLIGFPGELFIRMVKMILIPLVVTSVISSISQINAKVIGSLGVRVFIYCVGTTFVGSAIGVLSCHFIRPGHLRETEIIRHTKKSVDIGIVLVDTLRNFIPENILAACVQKTATISVMQQRSNASDLNATDNGTMRAIYSQTTTSGANILGLMVFSIAFGVILTQVAEYHPKAHVMVDFFKGFNAAIFKVVGYMMWFCPLGILSLVAQKIADKGGAGDLFYVALLYCVCASACLLFHALIILPLLFFLCTRRNPYKLILSMLPAMAVAFGTESSAITLSTTMECLHKYGVSPTISKFVAPIAMSVNMNGAALSYGMVAVFIAQYDNISLSTSDLVVTMLMAMLTAFMGQAMPTGGASFTSVAIIFEPVNIPVGDFVYVLPLNWLRARFSTTVNVLGDCFCAAIINETSTDLLSESRADDSNDTEVPKEDAAATIPVVSAR